jgi:hypothetical protein
MTVLISILIIASIIVKVTVINGRAKAVLHAWAVRNGFHLLSFEERILAYTGPFRWWTNSRGQVVYFVRVLDGAGHERQGWVRCGSHWGGVLFSKKAEVRWKHP